MSLDWFRSWHGAPTDIKWLAVAKAAGEPVSLVVSLAWCLLDRASQADKRGDIAGINAGVLSAFLGCEPSQIEAIVQAMGAMGILSEGRFANWEKRQPIREDGSAARAAKWRQARREGGDLDGALTASERTRTQPTPRKRQDKETDTDSSLRSERARPLKGEDLTIEFETFWETYPQHVGKAAARNAFKRACQRVELTELMAGLNRYLNKQDDRHWCNPATWLNQDRWMDQPAIAPTRGALTGHRSVADAAANLLRVMDAANE